MRTRTEPLNKKPEFYTLASPIKSGNEKTPITLSVGDVILFEDEPNDLYKIVYREATGELAVRFCWDDGRYTVEPSRPLSRIIITDPEKIKKVMPSRSKTVVIRLVDRCGYE